ncbi:TonB-dependent receptor [Altererythrobacter sp. GH1-8]|uniref:TonB-dependent receptor n=1 Tax=Altererythrobacter sp. GH1-8 TaxID=3349333 RepID=UPI00374DA519
MLSSTKRNLAVTCSLVSILALTSQPVMAQDENTQPQATTSAPANGGEIIVTARKRDETLLEVPVAVTAFSQENLDKLGVNSLQDLSSFAPGFDFNNNDRVNSLIRFRGLEAVVNTPASRTGAVFWDGAYVSDGNAILPLFDLGRVEVIKGPQNAFFGRNTFSGAVNFISAEPGDDWSGKAMASYSPSHQDSHNLTFAVGGPVSDTVGIRVAGMTERVGGDWEYLNGDPYGQINTDALMASIVFRPNDALKIKANGFYVWSDDTIVQASQQGTTAPGDCNQTYSGDLRRVATGEIVGSFSTDLSNSTLRIFCRDYPDLDDVAPDIPLAGQFGPDFLTFGAVTPALATTLPVELEGRGLRAPDGLGGKYRLWRGNLTADYTLANDATISAILSRGEASNYNIQDSFFGDPLFRNLGLNTVLFGFIRWTRDSFAEVRYTSEQTGPLRYMLGFSYYDQKLESSGLQARKVLNFENGENYGIFGSVDYDITEQLTLSLEGRWNKDKQVIEFNGPTEILPTETPAVLGEEQSFSKFMPRVILSYQPNTDMNLYASWSKSNIQGVSTNAENYAVAVPGAGLNADTVGFFTPVQTLEAYEIGLKHQVDDWLYYSIAAYYWDWKNQVFAELSSNFTPLNLAGDSEIKGVDIEAVLTPTTWLRLSGSANYNDIELQDFAGAGSLANAVLAPGLATGGVQIDSSGGRPRWNPKWSGSLSAELDMGDILDYEPGAFIRVDGAYTGRFFTDNFGWASVPGYWKFNARAGVNLTDNFALEVYGNNIFNDLSWGTSVGDTSTLGGRKGFGVLPRKREVGVRLIAEF